MARVLWNDPGIGVVRQADAGYDNTLKAFPYRFNTPPVGPTHVPTGEKYLCSTDHETCSVGV